MRIDRRTTLALVATTSALPFLTVPATARTARGSRGTVDWPDFLSRHDMVWDRLPKSWDEAPFLGNGMMGAMLYVDASSRRIRLDLGRSDVEDHRRPVRDFNFDNARLPIGHFLLRTRGRPTGRCALRLALHDAVLTGDIPTDRGRISLRAYVHAVDMTVVVEMRTTAGERGAAWEWIGEQANSPRQTYSIEANQPDRGLPGYRNNPPGIRTRDGREELWLQPLLIGGGTATAWRADRDRLVASVAHQFPGDGARATALATVRRFVTDAGAWRRHRDWWHDYYPASFLSIPDTRIESFYWIQMYKLASATRGDRALIDNQGPWLVRTAWPSTWWNLNVQLTYWPAIASNRSHLVGSLIGAIHRARDTLIANVDAKYRADSASLNRTSGSDLDSPVSPPRMVFESEEMTGMASVGRAPEVGNLPWALHDIWLVWRHTQDDALLRDMLFPVLRRTTNYYRHFLTKRADGKLHLPTMYSPEYAAAPDLNYDLALLRWSCTALLAAADRLSIRDPLIPEWRGVLRDLVDYPQDANGYMIGAGTPLRSSHRHFSHLLMAYPLHLVNKEQPGAAERVQRSVDHWQSMPDQLRGYSSTGASLLSSAFGKGDQALKYLQGLFDDYLRPNTLYKESGPVIETPLSGAQCVHDMLMQSWGGVIRVFPAMPAAWADGVFSTLSAEGGFLVSARRGAGTTRWIEVRSRAGEPFALETDIADPEATVDGAPRPLRRDERGYYGCSLARGETILIHPRGQRPSIDLAPIPAGVTNSFGVNANSRIREQRDMTLNS